MKIAIRDDDLCAYSDYRVFHNIYAEIGIPVSAAVIPFAVPNHGDSFPYGQQPRDTPRLLIDNAELVSSLKRDVDSGLVEILLHGYTHEYLHKDGRWIPEMLWKKEDRLLEELSAGKSLLESAFGQPVRVFVAPSQAIGSKGIAALEALGLSFSGSPNRWKDRSPSARHCINLFKRHWERLLYGRPCTFYKYRRHIEIPVVGLTNLETLKKYYFQCKKHDWNLVIVVHYWRLSKYPLEFQQLLSFVKFARASNAEFGFVSDCFPKEMKTK